MEYNEYNSREQSVLSFLRYPGFAEKIGSSFLRFICIENLGSFLSPKFSDGFSFSPIVTKPTAHKQDQCKVGGLLSFPFRIRGFLPFIYLTDSSVIVLNFLYFKIPLFFERPFINPFRWKRFPVTVFHRFPF